MGSPFFKKALGRDTGKCPGHPFLIYYYWQGHLKKCNFQSLHHGAIGRGTYKKCSDSPFLMKKNYWQGYLENHSFQSIFADHYEQGHLLKCPGHPFLIYGY